jgi:beta-glucosidase
VVRLIGYQRVPLAPGEAARVTFTVHADLASFTGLAGQRIVEPGDVELRFGRSAGDVTASVALRVTGAVREVGPGRRLLSEVRVEAVPLPASAFQEGGAHGHIDAGPAHPGADPATREPTR